MQTYIWALWSILQSFTPIIGHYLCITFLLIVDSGVLRIKCFSVALDKLRVKSVTFNEVLMNCRKITFFIKIIHIFILGKLENIVKLKAEIKHTCNLSTFSTWLIPFQPFSLCITCVTYTFNRWEYYTSCFVAFSLNVMGSFCPGGAYSLWWIFILEMIFYF